jgi:L-threonylcarbamoyladenylate synthase
LIVFIDQYNPSSEIIQASKNFIEAGELIIHPTETIYGFGCLATNPYALRELGALKMDGERTRIVLILKDWVSRFVESAERFSDLFGLWPAPLTMILPGKPNTLPPSLYNERGGLALRVSPSVYVSSLLEALDKPIVSTSVNRSGEPPMVNPEEIIKEFSNKIPLIVLAGVLKGPASTVVDCMEAPLIKIIREGAFKRNELQKNLPRFEIV